MRADFFFGPVHPEAENGHVDPDGFPSRRDMKNK
jgi:hypothetical protein